VEVNIVKSDKRLMEILTDIMIDQEPKDRRGYIEVACEAMGEETNPGALMQLLYSDFSSKANIDFGKIPDSKGDITKFDMYDKLSWNIRTINELLKTANHQVGISTLNTLNEVHDTIIKLRKDFEYGFKFDIDVVKLQYNMLVASLYVMVDILIVGYNKFLISQPSRSATFEITKGNLMIIQFAESFLDGVKKGSWATLMKSYQQHNALVPGTEGPISNMALGFLSGAAPKVMSALGVITKLPGPLKIVGAVIAIFLIIRVGVYYFFNKAVDVSDEIERQNVILKKYMETSQDAPKAVEKQNKRSVFLDNVAKTIEVKILKNEEKARQDIAKANKENLNPSALKDATTNSYSENSGINWE
jgi:hypothetical protein